MGGLTGRHGRDGGDWNDPVPKPYPGHGLFLAACGLAAALLLGVTGHSNLATLPFWAAMAALAVRGRVNRIHRGKAEFFVPAFLWFPIVIFGMSAPLMLVVAIVVWCFS